LIGAYALVRLILASPDAINPFSVRGDMYMVSSWVLLLGGVLIFFELVAVVWIGERVKAKFTSPVAVASALVFLFLSLLFIDGVLFPLFFMPMDEQILMSMAGGLAGKLVLGLLFSVPLILHFALYPAPVRNFQRVPIRLSELFKRRAVERLGSDPQGLILANQTKEQLVTLVSRLSTAASAADMGIWEYDGALGTLDWDQRASAIHRVKTETQEHGLESYWATVHEKDRPELQRRFLAMAQGELESDSLTYRLHPSLESDGLPVYLKLQALVDRSDQELRILGAVTDVSKERRMASENRLLQARVHQLQKMEAVDRFAGSIAHDFNNLLTPIIGHAELMQTQLEAGSSLSQNVDEIYKAADRSRELIQQLLAFGRDPTLEKVPINLSRVIRDNESILRSLVGSNVSVEFDLVVNAIALVNRAQFEQALINLAANARDAINHTGSLDISTALIEIDVASLHEYPVQKTGEFVQLQVKDDGAGMDEATLAHAFEPYFTTKELGRGTGLGMYTIYNFVQQNGGYVWLESSEGIGTTATILLPAQP